MGVQVPPSTHNAFPRGRHRKVLVSDVIAFQRQRAKNRVGRMQIVAIIEANGLQY
jgi:hypothetical protein